MAGSILLPLPEEEARMLNEVNDEADQVEKERVATETVRHAEFERLERQHIERDRAGGCTTPKRRIGFSVGRGTSGG